MNKNIEIIIPGKMAAVRFSYIPFIGDIQYVPGSEIPAYSEPLRITDQGMFLLNKDDPGYESLKEVLSPLVRLPYKQLCRKRSKLEQARNPDIVAETYRLCIEAELERREKAKRRR